MSDDIKKPEAIQSTQAGMEKPKKKTNKKGLFSKIIIVLIVVVIILGGLYFIDKKTSVNIFGAKEEKVTVTDWQAVFLTNGQVYFGKVQSYSSRFLSLEDIYYLQVVQAPLQQTQEGGATQAQTQAQNELSLVKLGNELHGPENAMKINSDQILFTEKLKSDSKVVDAITRYLEEQKKK